MAASTDFDNGLPTDGASVVVLRRDAVLLVERARLPLQGLWSFPGGKSEPGENAEQTARREVLEETGLRLGRLVRLGASHPVPENPEFRLAVFAALAGDGSPRANDDAARAEFVAFSGVLSRRTTSGAAGWIARAISALAEPTLL